MMDILVPLNIPQTTSKILDPVSEIDIWGRGTGKSFIIGDEIDDINRKMPRAITSITGQTYGQLMTRTLPSSFKYLESIGYEKDIDYVINRKPPKHFITPYETIMKHENFISFATGNGYLMLSQDRAGSSRGPNVDREIIDEALTLNKERYDQEVSPTNRGNEQYFGFLSGKPLKKHHGFRYVSSMPYSQEQKWLLDFGKYYEEEAGIMLFQEWNRIVKLQMQLIEAKKENNARLFKDIWNETLRLKRKITPFVSKNGILFTLANAFDNIHNLGLSYIMREFDKQTLLTFMIEIMNMIIDKVEDCYYQLNSDRHIYYNAYNDSFIRDYAENTNWDFNKLGTPDSRFDLDCNPNKPLELSFDWGARISVMSIAQEGNWDFVLKKTANVDNTINEFYVKPDDQSTVMINALVKEFSSYYSHHINKSIIYYRDRYGDHKQANSAKTYNEQAISQLNNNGWRVIQKTHEGQEPPHHNKYLLWGNILKETEPKFSKFRINGLKCKYTLISMNNTKVIEREGKFKKDKSSELQSSTVLPEEATHFGDAVDKRIWTKYNKKLKGQSTFIPARI
jgi:hypothetical protein